MSSSLLRVLLIIPFVSGLPCMALDWDPANPDDPDATVAAQAALAGAPEPVLIHSDIRTCHAEIRDLPGLSGAGLSLQRNIDDLEQALRALDAEILAEEIRISLSADLLFDFDEYQIKPEAEVELRTLTIVLKETDSGQIRIVGHTDAIGSEDYNQGLSERRAVSIKQWLMGPGRVKPNIAIETIGRGESAPVAPNSKFDGSDDVEGRALNRRVEIFIQTRGPVAGQVPANAL